MSGFSTCRSWAAIIFPTSRPCAPYSPTGSYRPSPSASPTGPISAAPDPAATFPTPATPGTVATGLIATTDRLEKANGFRVQCLAELARRRQVTMRALMDELGIKPKIYG